MEIERGLELPLNSIFFKDVGCCDMCTCTDLLCWIKYLDLHLRQGFVTRKMKRKATKSVVKRCSTHWYNGTLLFYANSIEQQICFTSYLKRNLKISEFATLRKPTSGLYYSWPSTHSSV